jgi:hypothetical protein
MNEWVEWNGMNAQIHLLPIIFICAHAYLPHELPQLILVDFIKNVKMEINFNLME